MPSTFRRCAGMPGRRVRWDRLRRAASLPIFVSHADIRRAHRGALGDQCGGSSRNPTTEPGNCTAGHNRHAHPALKHHDLDAGCVIHPADATYPAGCAAPTSRRVAEQQVGETVDLYRARVTCKAHAGRTPAGHRRRAVGTRCARRGTGTRGHWAKWRRLILLTRYA